MKAWPALRIIARALRQQSEERQALITELRALNASLRELVLIQGYAARFPGTTLPAIDPAPREAVPHDLQETALFAEVEIARATLRDKLQREPLDDEVTEELSTMMRRARV